jgi:hypothetical protein
MKKLADLIVAMHEGHPSPRRSTGASRSKNPRSTTGKIGNLATARCSMPRRIATA